jgi:WD40 repeat protein
VDTKDAYDLAWSPDGRFIAVWDSVLDYNIMIYHPDGRLASSYSAYDTGLGIKKVQWSPSGQFLGIGSFDEIVNPFDIVQIIESLNLDSSHRIKAPKICPKICCVL